VSQFENYLDRIIGAAPSRNSMYFERGTYLVRIDDLLFSTNRNGEVNSIWESTILRSNNADLASGVSTGWLQKMNRDTSPGNIKMNLCGALGVSVSDLDGDAGRTAITRAYSDEKDGKSPLSGCLCKVLVIQRTSKAGNKYSFTTFEKYPVQDESQIPSSDEWVSEFGVQTTADWTSSSEAADAASLDNVPF